MVIKNMLPVRESGLGSGQGLSSNSPLRKYGRVTHPQSTDRIYTAFRLLESMGELLVHCQRIWVVHSSTLFACLFTKFESCSYAQTIPMHVLGEYLDIHKDIFQIKGALTE